MNGVILFLKFWYVWLLLAVALYTAIASLISSIEDKIIRKRVKNDVSVFAQRFMDDTDAWMSRYKSYHSDLINRSVSIFPGLEDRMERNRRRQEYIDSYLMYKRKSKRKSKRRYY